MDYVTDLVSQHAQFAQLPCSLEMVMLARICTPDTGGMILFFVVYRVTLDTSTEELYVLFSLSILLAVAYTLYTLLEFRWYNVCTVGTP